MGDRLRLWCGKVFGTQFNASVALVIQQSTLYRYMKGENSPGAEFLIRLAENGCNINWLLTGEGDMFSDSEVGRRHARRLGNDATLGEGASDAPDSTGYAKGLDSPTGRQSLRRQKKGDDQGLGQ
jgi:transcriptional regulator with XRE-family HTH domain